MKNKTKDRREVKEGDILRCITDTVYYKTGTLYLVIKEDTPTVFKIQKLVGENISFIFKEWLNQDGKDKPPDFEIV